MAIRYAENEKTVRKVQALEVSTKILRNKTRDELAFAQCSLGGESEAGCDGCYCEPYVRISKRLSGTNTYVYQEWIACSIWERSPASKTKYQMSWIKRLAIDEALRTKGFRFVIYLRVPSDSPKGYFERPEPITVGSKERSTDHTFAITRDPSGI